MNKVKTLMTGILLVFASFAINANAGFITDANRIDLAYDTAHQVLYISGGETVRRYDMVNKKFLKPIWLGGDTVGMDISADGKLLAVANDAFGPSENFIDIIDLRDLSAQRVRFDSAPAGDSGTFAVAFDALGGILVSSNSNGTGGTTLKKYNYFTKKTTAFGLVAYESMLTSSIDKKIIAVAESSSGPASNLGIYKAGDESFVIDKSSIYYNFEVGASYNGKQITALTLAGAVVIDNKRTFPIIGDPAGIKPIGVAYSPVNNLVYFAMSNSDYIAAYNSNTMTEVAQYKVPGHFDEPGGIAPSVDGRTEGRTKIAGDNSFLFSTVDNGVYYLPLRKAAQ